MNQEAVILGHDEMAGRPMWIIGSEETPDVPIRDGGSEPRRSRLLVQKDLDAILAAIKVSMLVNEPGRSAGQASQREENIEQVGFSWKDVSLPAYLEVQ